MSGFGPGSSNSSAIVADLATIETSNAAIEASNAIIEASTTVIEASNATIEASTTAIEASNAALEISNAAIEANTTAIEADVDEVEGLLAIVRDDALFTIAHDAEVVATTDGNGNPLTIQAKVGGTGGSVVQTVTFTYDVNGNEATRARS